MKKQREIKKSGSLLKHDFRFPDQKEHTSEGEQFQNGGTQVFLAETYETWRKHPHFKK